MSTTTTVLGLIKHVDGDNVRAGETTDASANMDVLDALFHAATGHDHDGTDSKLIPYIAFPAIAVPSADPNTLDDYEEGTWTPSIGGDATYEIQQGLYTKIGRMAHITCALDINVKGTGSVGIISGLPFTPIMEASCAFGYFAASATGYVSLYGFTSGTTIILRALTAAGVTTLAATFFQNTTMIRLSMSYPV